MKKLVVLLLVILFSCSDDDISIDKCSYPFIEDDYELNFQTTCIVLNDTLKTEMYFTSYEYLRDSLAHCQPDQTIEICE